MLLHDTLRWWNSIGPFTTCSALKFFNTGSTESPGIGKNSLLLGLEIVISSFIKQKTRYIFQINLFLL